MRHSRLRTTDDGARQTTLTRYEGFQRACNDAGFFVARWSPSDGKTRYRFFSKPSGYFGPRDGDYTALGWKQAVAYALGRGAKFWH
jgi:hypothetical protein